MNFFYLCSCLSTQFLYRTAAKATFNVKDNIKDIIKNSITLTINITTSPTTVSYTHLAVVRNILYKNEKNIEFLVTYEPKLHYLIEWWKQLVGESEGKEGKGIFPTGAEFTTDLHSLGQYIQEGRRNLFETVINIKKSQTDITINQDEDNLDELNYLVGKGLDYVNKKAMEGTIEAHLDGGVPNIVLNIDELNEFAIGHLIYFFELACAMSGKILGINPFNQPGVEKYKTNMFKLLKKPGYEQ